MSAIYPDFRETTEDRVNWSRLVAHAKRVAISRLSPEAMARAPIEVVLGVLLIEQVEECSNRLADITGEIEEGARQRRA
jgi:hypothetical protein